MTSVKWLIAVDMANALMGNVFVPEDIQEMLANKVNTTMLLVVIVVVYIPLFPITHREGKYDGPTSPNRPVVKLFIKTILYELFRKDLVIILDTTYFFVSDLYFYPFYSLICCYFSSGDDKTSFFVSLFYG